MNKYMYVFAGFMIVVFVAYIATRADFNFNSVVDDVNEPRNAQAVVVKKAEAKNDLKSELLKDTSGDYYLGNEYAPVLMIEYASLSCPHCARFHENILEPLIKSHINAGKLKYVYRDFPLNAPALKASVLAHCAGEKRYFSFLKVLFKSQGNWAFNQNYLEVLKKIARLGGIDEQGFEVCMANEEIEKKVLEQRKVADEVLNVQSTPTIFINGLEYTGDKTYEDVAEYIDAILTSTK